MNPISVARGSWLPCASLLFLCLPAPAHAGELLVPSRETDSVLRFDDATGAFLGVLVAPGAGGLVQPEAATIGPDGALVVCSFGDDRVLRFDAQTGAFLGELVSAGDGGLSGPTQAVFGPDGHLYVLGAATRGVLRYNGETGWFLGTFLGAGGGLSGAEALAFGPDGDLYLCSATNARVLRYDGETGALLGTFVSGGSGGLILPQDLAFGPGGDLYVASADGTVKRYAGATGAYVGDFVTGAPALPRALDFRPDGRLWVAGFGADAIHRFDAQTGAFVDAVVPSGTGGLDGPAALAFTEADELGIWRDESVFTAFGAQPGETLFFLVGVNPGARPIPGCAVTVGIDRSTLVGTAVAGPDGTASVTWAVPATVWGRSLLMQVAAPTTCRTSGVRRFTPLEPIEIVEDFATQDRLDATRSGGEWGLSIPPGTYATRGIGGGSGRLGDLELGPGETLVLSTDSQAFPVAGQASQVLGDAVPGVDYDPADPATWPAITVTDGVFEFQSLRLASGSTLRFVGERPARVLVRGEAVCTGRIDVSGAGGGLHDSALAYSFGGAGGPGAGGGGDGGTRYDHAGDPLGPGNSIIPVPGLGGPVDFPFGSDIDGSAGQGVGGSDAPFGGGVGGVHWPPVFPMDVATTMLPPDGLAFSDVGTFACRSYQVGGPGAGGAYASAGGPGVATIVPELSIPGTPNAAPDTPGASDGFTQGWLDEGARSLDPSFPLPPFGLLRGGAGGGGGGAHLFGTRSAGVVGACTGFFSPISQYYDHSGAAGGGGGGALQLTAGSVLRLQRTLDASGGAGGSSLFPGAPVDGCQPGSCGAFAAPGGGGAGGAVRLQSRVLDLAGTAVVDVRGGAGGVGVGGSTGGAGGHGLVRLEQAPRDPADAIELADGLDAVLPDQGGDPDALVLSLAEWTGGRERPESFSSVTSCWYRPDGLARGLVLDPDLDPVRVDQQGWNATVFFAIGGTVQEWPLRGVPDDPLFPLGGTSFEDLLGNSLAPDPGPGEGSYLAIRFQGARSTGALADPCAVDLDGAQIVPGSLTPWVSHPADLNAFAVAPDMIRFCIVWDASRLVDEPVLHDVVGIASVRVGAHAE